LPDILKKLFIVAPHFPPSSAPPSQRVRLLVRHCSEFGFYPFIFTVDPKYREEAETDTWMCELLGKEYEEIRVNCFDQKKTRKIGIGDLGLRMMPFLFFKLRKEIKHKKPDLILYPVPPWYILIIAPIIKWFSGVKYGIDFIDPWVHEQEAEHANFKHRASQRIARRLEGWITKHADIIFSVSEGINENLRTRHPKLSGKPMYAVPYGAEPGDFAGVKSDGLQGAEKQITIRYIGAVWNDCYPVLDGLMPALAAAHKEIPFVLEFYGTSYAGEGLAKPQLGDWIQRSQMQDYTSEQELRVSYKRAVQLTMDADLLFLMGGMQPYYAASKLMGLVVSGKPFVAFLHKDSFPALFLKKLEYPYIVTYSAEENELPAFKIEQLCHMFVQLIKTKEQFQPLNLQHPLIIENTAKGMTKFFLDKINAT
jgi:hypothetical protein